MSLQSIALDMVEIKDDLVFDKHIGTSQVLYPSTIKRLVKGN